MSRSHETVHDRCDHRFVDPYRGDAAEVYIYPKGDAAEIFGKEDAAESFALSTGSAVKIRSPRSLCYDFVSQTAPAVSR